MFGVGVGIRVGGFTPTGSAAPYVGLLDTYPGAAAAYSVRLLKSTYTGSAIRVRRSSDNAEQDIGFSGGNLDTSALTSFCGAGNGFVTTWYDQSGNGINATQTTAANQPQIVSSGNLITTNSKPTMRFDGVNDSLSLGNQTLYTSTMIQVIRRNGTAADSYHPIFTGTTGGPQYYQHYVPNSTNVSNIYFGSNLNTGQSFDTTLQCFQTYFDSTIRQFKNNVIGTTTTATLTSENTGIFNLGNYSSNFLNADFSEFIWYSNSQLSNQNGIYTNINSYYTF